MKRSVNLNGFQPSHRRISPADMIATFRALGYTDEQIRQMLIEMQEKANGATPAATANETPEVPE